MMKCDDGGESPCDMYTNYANEQELIILSPLKTTYNIGESVKLKFSLPSKMKVNSKEIDIYQATKSTSGSLALNLSELFKGNTVIFIKGKKIDDYKFSPEYSNATDSYELEIDIVLNRAGIYSFESFANFQERESVDGSCIFLQLATDIKGRNDDDGRLEFVVN